MMQYENAAAAALLAHYNALIARYALFATISDGAKDVDPALFTLTVINAYFDAFPSACMISTRLTLTVLRRNPNLKS